MKQLLLTLVATLLTAFGMSATETTFTFWDGTTDGGYNNYGLQPPYTDSNTKCIANGSSTTLDAVTLTLSGDKADCWKNWNTGLRAMAKTSGKNPKLTVKVNGGTITKIEFSLKSALKITADKGKMNNAASTSSNYWTGSDEEVTFTFEGGNNDIKVLAITYEGGEVAAVEAPTMSCTNNTVTIECATEGASIYYTTDGTEPTNASIHYTAPFAITENTTVKAIAYKGADASAVTTYNAVYVETYDGFATLYAKGKDAKGIVEGPLTAIYQNGQNLYMQDTKGYQTLVFGNVGVSDIENGNSFANLSATVGEYGKSLQLINPALGVKETSVAAIEPKVKILSEITADLIHNYVKVEGVSITDAPGVNKSNFNISDGTNTLVGRNNFAIDVQNGDNFTITGFVCVFNGTVQLYPVEITGGEVMETVATPTFSVEGGAVAAGTEVAISCETEGATIYYTVDGTDPTINSTEYTTPIEVNEAITLKAFAVKEGMVDSEIAAIDYTILVAGEEVISFSFEGVDNADVIGMADKTIKATNSTSNDSPNNLNGVTFTNDKVKCKLEKGDVTNVPRFWKSSTTVSELRVYSGNIMSIDVTEAGYKIVSIEFPQATGGGNKFGFGGTIDPSNGTWSNRTWTAPTTSAAENKAKAAGDNWTSSFKWTPNTQLNIGTISVRLVPDENAVPTGISDVNVEAEAESEAEYFTLQGIKVEKPVKGLYIKVTAKGGKVVKM